MSSVKQKLARLERAAHADDGPEVVVVWSDEQGRALAADCRRRGVKLVTVEWDDSLDLENDI